MKGLITGAGRGLGYELTRQGLVQGMELFGVCRPGSPGGLSELKEKYKEKLHILEMDITKEEEVKNAAHLAANEMSKLDFLINNAGVLMESRKDTFDPVTQMDIGMFRKTMDVNLIGGVIVLKYFAEYLYKAEKPTLLSITSEGGNIRSGGYQYLVYSVSKCAQNMYTQKIKNYLDETMPEKDLSVYMVHPGRMNTVMGAENAQIEASEAAEGIYKLLRQRPKLMTEIPFINYKGEPMPF